jgi:ABC-type sulfate transport system permease component
MNRQTLGILIGTICAIVFTPLVAMLWRRLQRPIPGRSTDLSAEAWRRSDTVSKEALIVTAAAGLLFVSYIGFGTVVDGVVVVMMISGVFGIPTAWVLLRSRIFGPSDAMEDFVRYFEQKHGISFKSWLYVGVPALIVSLGCLVAFLNRQ